MFPHTVTWKEVESKGLPECDVLINVSGENIFKPFFVKPFNDKYKQDITNSRVGCNHRLNEALRKTGTHINRIYGVLIKNLTFRVLSATPLVNFLQSDNSFMGISEL